MMMFVGFVLGVIVGSILTTIALLLAIGTTTRVAYYEGGTVDPETIERPVCPTCLDEMFPVKSQALPGYTGWECIEHGVMAWIDVR